MTQKPIWHVFLIWIIVGLCACQRATPTPLVATLPTDFIQETEADMPVLASIEEEISGDYEQVECPFRTYRGYLAPECGILKVLEDPKLPNGSKISLSVGIVRANEPLEKQDAVVFVFGDSYSQHRELFQYVYQELIQNRDLIFFDPRGMGSSEPSLPCPEIPEARLDAISKPSLGPDEYQALHQECRDNLQAVANLEGYTYDLNAKDLIALRKALGFQNWIIYTSRYGTPIAMKAAELDPDGVVSMVITDAIPPKPNIADRAAAAQLALAHFFEGCKNHERCNKLFPGLEDAFYEVVELLNTDPQLVVVDDTNSGNRYEVMVDGIRLVDLVLGFLDYEEDQVGQLPRTIYQLKNGKSDYLSTLLIEYIQGIRGNYEGLNTLEQCYEYSLITEADILQATGNLPLGLADYFENLFSIERAVCNTWIDETKPRPIPYNPKQLRAPVLLIAGELSWEIPSSWTSQLAESLPDATTVILPGAGLSGTQSRSQWECTYGLFLGFITDPEARLDTQCAAAEPEVMWITLP